MKNYILSAILILCMFSSCGFDEIDANYTYTSALFAYQDYNRNIVVGEGLELSAGITFSGVLTNQEDRVVNYIIDPSLITKAGYSALPPAYYTCSNPSQITVPKGEFKGYMPIKLDSVAFLNDPKSLTGEYILPIRLVSSSNVDSISYKTSFIRIFISYFAKQHGNYTYSGTTKKDKSGVITDITYRNTSTVSASHRILRTVGPTKMRMIADSIGSIDPAKGVYSFFIEAPTHGGGAVTISADPLSSVVVSPDGESVYDEATKTFRLKYSYTLTDGTVCNASDVLVFRNRIRDVQANGIYINEWTGF